MEYRKPDESPRMTSPASEHAASPAPGRRKLDRAPGKRIRSMRLPAQPGATSAMPPLGESPGAAPVRAQADGDRPMLDEFGGILARPATAAGGDAGQGVERLRGRSSDALPYQAQMEAAFDTDFSHVRVHLGASTELSLLAAEAAALGSDLVAFGSTTPPPETVAEELAHTEQFRRHGGGDSAAHGPRVSRPGDAAEREAKGVARDVAEGRPAPAVALPARSDAPASAAAAETGAEAGDGAVMVARPAAGSEGGAGDGAPKEDAEANEPQSAAGEPPAPVLAAPRSAPMASESAPHPVTAPESAQASATLPQPDAAASAPQGQAALAELEAVSWDDFPDAAARAADALTGVMTRQAESVTTPPQVVTPRVSLTLAAEPSAPIPPSVPPGPDQATASAPGEDHEPGAGGPTGNNRAGQVSAGPRPQVPLHGHTDPARVDQALAATGESGASALVQTEATLAAVARQPRSLVVDYRPAVIAARPAAELAAPALDLPQVDPALSPEMRARLAPSPGELAADVAAMRQAAGQEMTAFDQHRQALHAETQANIAKGFSQMHGSAAAIRERSQAAVEQGRQDASRAAQAVQTKHAVEAHAVHAETARLTEVLVQTGERSADTTLRDAETRASGELAAAQGRAQGIMGNARQRASAARPSGTVMRREIPGTQADEVDQNQPDGAAILAEAEAEVAAIMAQVEALTLQLIEAGRSRAHDEIAQIRAQLEVLFAQLEQRLVVAQSMLEERMPLVAEEFQATMDAVIASARAQTSQVEAAAHAGASSWLDALEAQVTTSAASSQRAVAKLFDDTMVKYRIVDTAEAISERSMAGDCFERDESGQLLHDEAGNLIPNITEGEYMLLFEAAEIQSGVPAELLKALAHGEVNTAIYQDAMPRHFYDGSAMYSGSRTSNMGEGGRASWGRTELDNDDVPPVVFGIDREAEISGRESYGLGWMQLTAGESAISSRYDSEDPILRGWGDGGTLDIQRAIDDPYYNVLRAAELMLYKDEAYWTNAGTAERGRERPARPDATSGDAWDDFADYWARGATQYQTANLGKPENIAGRMAMTDEEWQEYRDSEGNWGSFSSYGAMQGAKEGMVSEARVIVSPDPDVPIPDDLFLVRGTLQQMGDNGFAPVPEGAAVAMDGRYFELRDGELVEIQAPAEGQGVVETQKLGGS